ncbi:MAG: hypothetical protein ACTS5I_05875 [Rhodanobacter sp.]
MAGKDNVWRPVAMSLARADGHTMGFYASKARRAYVPEVVTLPEGRG